MRTAKIADANSEILNTDEQRNVLFSDWWMEMASLLRKDGHSDLVNDDTVSIPEDHQCFFARYRISSSARVYGKYSGCRGNLNGAVELCRSIYPYFGRIKCLCIHSCVFFERQCERNSRWPSPKTVPLRI